MAARANHSPRGLVRRVRSTVVLAALMVLGLLTILTATQSWWAATVAGLVLLHLGTVVAVLGPWGKSTQPSPHTMPIPNAADRATSATASGKGASGKGASGKGASGKGASGKEAEAGDQTDLERRVDALGARLLASSERTRVELLDALAESTHQDHRSRGVEDQSS